MSKDVERDGETRAQRPDKKKFRAASGRLRNTKSKTLGHRASIDWRLDARNVCAAGQRQPVVFSLADLRALLMQSRTGEMLLTGASAENLDIVYDTQIPVSQFYPSAPDGRRVIALNPHRPKGDLVNTCARELRRVWQYHQGALVNPLSFEPDEAILINRAQQADALMVSIKIAWELKLGGESEAWDFMIGSPLADIGRTFEIKAQTDFRTLNNGQAARAAYDKFFEDSRTKMHDKRIIHQMLLDETGYIKSTEKRPKVSMDLFKRLGELPHGRNYLSMKGSHAPMDTRYATVEDRSNANFLWFIKFERSFQEKELQMVQESVKLSAEIVDFARFAQARDASHGPEHRA